jgi:hypothetical protein
VSRLIEVLPSLIGAGPRQPAHLPAGKALAAVVESTLIPISRHQICALMYSVSRSEDHNVAGSDVTHGAEVPAPMEEPWTSKETLGVPVAIVAKANIIITTGTIYPFVSRDVLSRLRETAMFVSARLL